MSDEMTLVVSSKVRAYLKSKNTKMSSELPAALNKKMMMILDEAAARCRGNKRSTVKAQDV